LGSALADVLGAGDVVLLEGDLGGGKTALARAAIRRRLQVAGRNDEDIPSPTFTIVQTYEADVPIWHADLYRLSCADEVWELGLEDAFLSAITFIEWPDRLGALTPHRRLVLTLRPTQDGGRSVSWATHGKGWERVETLLKKFGASEQFG
jgi:tRNA threonylcarbamoyladenosine biosynthesis protein TsaE